MTTLYEFRNLDELPLSTLTTVFNCAFAEYFVPMQSDETQMAYRLARGRVQLPLSVGAFIGEELVGFILSGYDYWQGAPTIYNAATGVVPEHRGQGLVSRMYAYVLPQWRARGIHQTTLEVITENAVALRAYDTVGFEIVREFHAYRWTTKSDQAELALVRADTPNWESYRLLRAFSPSWDYTESGIAAVRSHYQYWEVYTNTGDLRAFAIVHKNGQIAQAGCRQAEDWLPLLRSLGIRYPQQRWINLPDTSPAFAAIETLDGKCLLSQYEMICHY